MRTFDFDIQELVSPQQKYNAKISFDPDVFKNFYEELNLLATDTEIKISIGSEELCIEVIDEHIKNKSNIIKSISLNYKKQKGINFCVASYTSGLYASKIILNLCKAKFEYDNVVLSISDMKLFHIKYIFKNNIELCYFAAPRAMDDNHGLD